MKYAGVKPTGKLPNEINFPLYTQKENTQFKVLVFGDPQPYDEKEIDYFRRGIVNEVKNNKKDAVFGISLGDLVGDDLSLHPHYIDAVKEMTLNDALKIISGPKDGATNYFKEKTKEKLLSAFAPSVQSSLEKVDATKYYADLATTYNKLPTSFKKIDPDLTSFVVGKAVDALFDQVAKEEMNIRANPLARGSDILKKVFGSK